MKLAICVLLFSALYVDTTAKSSGSDKVSQETSSPEWVLEQKLDMVLSMLEQMDRKLLELQSELMEQRKEMEQNQANNEKMFADVAKDVARNISSLQDQSFLILAKQSACASHEQFREESFYLTVKGNEEEESVQPLEAAQFMHESTASPTVTTITVNSLTTTPTPTTPTSTEQFTPATSTTKATTPTTAPTASPPTPSTTSTTIKPPTTPRLTTTTLDPKSPTYSSCRNVPSNVSGIYIIELDNGASFNVYCEQEKFGGGWIVVQHRFDGSVDFYRIWDEYRDGFGELDSEFWLGLQRIHELTSARTHEIVIELKDFQGNYGFTRYSRFQIGGKIERYRLRPLGSYSGTAGDGMDFNQWAEFSTKDRNNDNRSDAQWAVRNEGGWWYGFSGGSSNLNGRYQEASEMKSNRWYQFKNDWRGMSFTRMMIRELED